MFELLPPALQQQAEAATVRYPINTAAHSAATSTTALCPHVHRPALSP